MKDLSPTFHDLMDSKENLRWELLIKHIKQVKNTESSGSLNHPCFREQKVPLVVFAEEEPEDHRPGRAPPTLCSAAPSGSPPSPRHLRPTLIVEHAHGAVTLVVGHSSTERTVHRYLKIVGSQAVAVSIRIGKKAALQLQMKQVLCAVTHTTEWSAHLLLKLQVRSTL